MITCSNCGKQFHSIQEYVASKCVPGRLPFPVVQAQAQESHRYAWRQWNDHTIFYVAHLPGDGGKDWGYTTLTRINKEFDKPILLSPYWQRRFRRDCERVGTVAHFQEVMP